MSKSTLATTSNSTQKSSSTAASAGKSSADTSRNGSASSASTANGSTSTSGSSGATSTTSSASSATKQATGPRRFRGDVPAFNPSSSSGSPHIYHPEMRHYLPQSHASQPMYPTQNPQFYSQQPQLMFNGQMMQPYYPIAMGYPDYAMYQPYQYYMANPYQAQAPMPYMNNMNGFGPNNNNHHNQNNNNNNNRKKHSRNNYYANHNSNNHNLHPNHVNGKHTPTSQHHSNMSSYPSNSSNTDAASQDHLAHSPGPYASAPAASTQPTSSMTNNKDTKAGANALEHQQNGAANIAPVTNTHLSRSTQTTAPKSPVQAPVSKAPKASGKPVTTNDNDPNDTAQKNATTPATETKSDSTTTKSAQPVPKYPLLFNLTAQEHKQERIASIKPNLSFLKNKSLHQNTKQISSSGNLHVDTDVQFKVINHNDGSESQKHLCNQSVIKNFKPTTVSNPPANAAKAPMNWASLLSSSAKKSTTQKSKSSTSTTRASETQKSPESKSASPNNRNKISGPQPLGLIALMMLYDPSFDINSVKGFSLKPRGLTNSGNICYMNAVLQCLMFCPSFNRIFSFIGDKSIGSLGEKSPTPLIDATISFLTDFVNVPAAQNGGSVVNADGIVVGRPLSPEKLYMKLIESPQFQHLTWGQQEDAEEFLGYLLDGIHEEFVKAEATVSPEKFEQLSVGYAGQLDSVSAAELKARMKSASRLVRSTSKAEDKGETEDGDDVGEKEWSEVGSRSQVSKKRVSEVEPSPITRLFGGKFRSVLTIPKGKEGNSITVDPFRSVSVDISQENVTTIEDALWQFNEIEKIPYKTESGLEVVAKKQTFIDGLPEILILQLKRFSYRNEEQADSDAQAESSNGTHGVGTIEKVMKTVNYGLDLTVAPEILSPSIRATASRNYSLIGVIYHHGRNAEGGHYTCDVLRQGQDWLRIDDTAVEAIHASKVTEKPEARDKSAYILMYQRKGEIKDASKRWWC